MELKGFMGSQQHPYLVSFCFYLAVPSTSNQLLQQQVKTNSTSLLRSSPGMGLGGVKINTSGPPIRIGLSRNVRVKPLHSHVSVQHWSGICSIFFELCFITDLIIIIIVPPRASRHISCFSTDLLYIYTCHSFYQMKLFRKIELLQHQNVASRGIPTNAILKQCCVIFAWNSEPLVLRIRTWVQVIHTQTRSTKCCICLFIHLDSFNIILRRNTFFKLQSLS